MKLKRFEIVDVCDVIDKMTGDYNKIFSYHISKIRKVLANEYELIVETGKPSKEYANYELERRRIINNNCVKDENNKLVEESGKFKIIKGNEEIVKTALRDLYNKNQDLITKREEEIKEFIKFLDEEIEVSIDQIPFSCLPELISKEDMSVFLPLI